MRSVKSSARAIVTWVGATAVSLAACGGSVANTSSGVSDGGGFNSSSGSGSGGSSSSSGLFGSSSSGSGASSSSGGQADAAGTGADAAADTTPPDTGTNPLDATFDVTPPAMGLAGFAFVVNGIVQTPLSCPAENWEYGLPQGQQSLNCSLTPPCAGVSSALLINTGAVPIAYSARSLWNGTGYVPGVDFGDPNELTGVLQPGQGVDITSQYTGEAVAVLGSSEPFSDDPDKYVADEGTLPWPAGVGGSNGSTQMFVAEINVTGTCMKPPEYSVTRPGKSFTRFRSLTILVVAACGGTGLVSSPNTTDAGASTDSSVDSALASDSGPDTSSGASDGSTASACTPGRSIACVGPGGCSSNQVCNPDGTAYGPCDCAPTTEAGVPMACIPGQSIACTGPGGCVSNQVCNAAGSGYGACSCTSDSSALLCVPGQSIACSGAGGCFANQVCDGDGMAYGPCVCDDGGSVECQSAGDCVNLLGPLPAMCISSCPPGSVGGADRLWRWLLSPALHLRVRGLPDDLLRLVRRTSWRQLDERRPLVDSPGDAVAQLGGDGCWVEAHGDDGPPVGLVPSVHHVARRVMDRVAGLRGQVVQEQEACSEGPPYDGLLERELHADEVD